MNMLLAAMTRFGARRAANAGLALLAILAIAVVLVPAALAIPQEGHYFYGKASTTNGTPLAAGTVVSAKALTGQWTGTATATVDSSGNYGYNPALLVPADDPDTPQIEGADPDDQIAFYLAGVRAQITVGGATTNTYAFQVRGLTNADLKANITYTIAASAGPNGSISPSGNVSVAYGGSATFNIAANAHYLIADVVVDGASQGPISSYTFTNVRANHTIAASFTPVTFTITPSAGAGGTITPNTPQTVAYGGSAAFTIAANAGYTIADVLVDGVSQGAIASYTFSNVTANHTISASFKPATFTITPSAGTGGTITPNTPQTVAYGGSAAFTIAADAGYAIADVLVDGVSQGAIASYTFSNVTANHTISASFKPATFTITPSAGTGGTITPNTPQTVAYGGSAAFTIAADAGYAIADVLVDGVSQGAIASYTFSNVTANHTIAASFKPLTFTITPSAGPGGTITPNTLQTVAYGGSAAFTIAANAGYAIADVLVDGVSQGAIASYTFSNVTADHTIAASFTPVTFTITPSAGAGGTITPNTPQTVAYGGSAAFAIAANAGYAIADVLVDGVSQGAIASYTFSNVTADHTISASFTAITFTITPSAGPGGTITPNTPQTVAYGGSAAFTIAANAGYAIADVLVDGVSQGAIASYAFSNVTANHTISASFTAITFTITPSAGPGGTITPNTPQTVAYGGSAAFTIAANAGYAIADVLVDGVSQGAIASYTFSNVTADHTISVSFKAAVVRVLLPLVLR